MWFPVYRDDRSSTVPVSKKLFYKHVATVYELCQALLALHCMQGQIPTWWASRGESCLTQTGRLATTVFAHIKLNDYLVFRRRYGNRVS